MTKESWKQLSRPVRRLVRDQVGQQCWAQVRVRVWNYVWTRLSGHGEYRIWEEVWIQLWEDSNG